MLDISELIHEAERHGRLMLAKQISDEFKISCVENMGITDPESLARMYQNFTQKVLQILLEICVEEKE